MDSAPGVDPTFRIDFQMKRLIYILILAIGQCCAQTEEVEFQLESLANEQSSDESSFEWIQNLEYFKEHPLSLNSKQRQKLSLLQILSPQQIGDLEQHIYLHGELLNFYELQVLPSWDVETIEKLRPYVQLKESSDGVDLNAKMWKEGQGYLLSRLNWITPLKTGYTGDSSAYRGGPLKNLNQLRYTYYNRLRVGFTLEKDPGEKMEWTKSTRGFDFVAGYLQYDRGKILDQIVIGDYQLQWGQGLIMWQGNSFGKTSDPGLSSRNSNSLRPYTSADELSNSRGVSSVFKWGKIAVHAHLSSKKRDALVSNGQATSWTQNGLHRTYSEQSKKKQLTENHGGLRMGYSAKTIALHLNAIHYNYSANLSKSIDLYQGTFQSLRSTSQVSLDYKKGWGNFYFFGDIGLTDFQYRGQMHGVMVAIGDQVSLSYILREFQNGFYTPYGNSLGRITDYSAEKGSYLVGSFKLTSKIKLSAYADFYRVDWLRFLVHAPNVGADYFLQLEWKPVKTSSFIIRYRDRIKQANSRNEEQDGIKELESVIQKWLRIQSQFEISEGFILRTRWEMTQTSRLSNNPEKGQLLYQDFIFKPRYKKWSINARYALFSIDSYDSRIYAYESSALYVYSVPTYYYQGARMYLIIKFGLRMHLDFWIRYARTSYFNIDEISSGNELIQGNKKHEFLLQGRWKLSYSKSKWKAERKL